MEKDQKRNNGEKKLVMAFGTFDFFHDGHHHFLSRAKELGDFLIVVIARDKTVRQIKGEEPANNERKRLNKVKSKGVADKVILGYHKDKHKVLRKYRPDIIALGYDQYVFTQTLKKTLIDLKMDTQIHRLEAHFPQVYKSSLIRRQKEEDLNGEEAVIPSRELNYNQ